MTLKDVAQIWAVSERTVRDLVDAGDIPFVDLSRNQKRRFMRFQPADVDAFIKRRKKIVGPLRPTGKTVPIAPSTVNVDFLAILEERKRTEIGQRRSHRHD